MSKSTSRLFIGYLIGFCLIFVASAWFNQPESVEPVVDVSQVLPGDLVLYMDGHVAVVKWNIGHRQGVYHYLGTDLDEHYSDLSVKRVIKQDDPDWQKYTKQFLLDQQNPEYKLAYSGRGGN